jgi:hypothetical protein
VKEEIACHDIFSASGRKLVLYCDMLMPCKDAAQEGFSF